MRPIFEIGQSRLRVRSSGFQFAAPRPTGGSQSFAPDEQARNVGLDPPVLPHIILLPNASRVVLLEGLDPVGVEGVL